MKKADTFEVIKEKCFNDLWLDIKGHWERLSSSETSDKATKFPWFGDIQYWIEVCKRNTSSCILKKFPSAIRENPSQPLLELHRLLPQTNLTKAFLPILLNGYFRNYRKNNCFFETITNEPVDDSVFERGMKLFITPQFTETYRKLSSKDCRNGNIGRILPVYLQIIQFLVFLTSTSQICNVSLSFFCFERMTGYLHLLGPDANSYLQKLDEDGVEPLLNSTSQYNDAIFKYAETVLRDLRLLKYSYLSNDKRVKNTRSLHFFYFVICLFEELWEGDIPPDEQTICKGDSFLHDAYMFKRIAEAQSLSENGSEIFDGLSMET